MIYLYDIVDEYNMTLSDLLETCVNLKVCSSPPPHAIYACC